LATELLITSTAGRATVIESAFAGARERSGPGPTQPYKPPGQPPPQGWPGVTGLAYAGQTQPNKPPGQPPPQGGPAVTELAYAGQTQPNKPPGQPPSGGRRTHTAAGRRLVVQRHARPHKRPTRRSLALYVRTGWRLARGWQHAKNKAGPDRTAQ